MNNVITKKLLLTFSGILAGKPIISELIRKHDIEINIYRAKITPNEEGHMAISITGKKDSVENCLSYIKKLEVKITETMTGLMWNEKKCVSCGNCLSHCPTKALYISDNHTRKVDFDGEKCIECLSCIKNCPFGACESFF